MEEPELIPATLAAILVLGVCTQWIAWRLKVPAILLLLVVGFVAGPITGFLDPQELLGDLLMPIVSLSVGLILFEGGLNLRFRELRTTWRSLLGLLTVGVIVTWFTTTAAAMGVLGLPLPAALLLGAVLVVTGPTVIGPLLRDIRPTGRVSAIAKWEGIVIDPIGATLALMVFEAVGAIKSAEFGTATTSAVLGLVFTGVTGTLVGVLVGLITVRMLRRYWIPDYLQSPMVLMFAVGTQTVSNLIFHESGLLAVTVLGIMLANQKKVDVHGIIHFKESLTVLLISTLFIVISARVPLASLAALGWRGPAFAAILILVVRPAAVWLSTVGSGLTKQERLFLCWLAPRGIVAASIASVFAVRMGDDGSAIAPATLIVIITTVTVYGLTAGRVARRLGLAVANPQGLLIAGATRAAREIAVALKGKGFHVVLVDTNYEQIRAARDAGLVTCLANVMSEQVIEEVDFGGLGKFLGMTTNDEVNTMAAARFREFFGREHVYQLPKLAASHARWGAPWQHTLAGQAMFDAELTGERLRNAFQEGATVKITRLTDTFKFDAFKAHYQGKAWPLFVIDGDRLTVVTTELKLQPKPGQSLVSLVMPGVADLLQQAAPAAQPATTPPAAAKE